MTRLTAQFSSTALSDGEYDTETQQLTLRFVNGRSYTFENVPVEIWEGLETASSPGSFYFTRIKDRY